MEDKYKIGWVIMHISCIIILILCLWRSKDLFQEPVKASGGIIEKDNIQEITNANDISNTPTMSITPELSIKPEITVTPTATLDTDQQETADTDGEKSETIQDTDDAAEKQSEESVPTEVPSASQDEKTNILNKYSQIRKDITEKIETEYYQQFDNSQHDWWFIRKENHKPSGSGAEIEIDQYSAFYRNINVTDEDKVIYLTFDCGYEIGCTSSILDTLSDHNAQAVFFVTKTFIEKNTDLVKRMKKEGHLVGNHTLNHPVMPSKDESVLLNELVGCAELFYHTTGYELDPFMRPPTGAYSERTLQLTKDLGYTTVFWSIAYKDYDTNHQPGRDYVIDHFKTYHHNGAIPLIHNTSTSNEEALDEVLSMLENEGYRYGSLYELLDKE